MTTLHSDSIKIGIGIGIGIGKHREAYMVASKMALASAITGEEQGKKEIHPPIKLPM